MKRPLRVARLALHVLSGALTILLLFPFLAPEERDRRVVRWAARLMAVLGVRVEVVGRPPAVRGEGALLVSNHVSWLDIHLLHSLLPFRFVSKAQVRDWPVLGRMAAAAGTIFLTRERKSDAARVNREMADLLRRGECLALFPEGTTTDGQTLLPFYPTLFQPAVEAQARVWPALIRYLDRQGNPTLAAAYHDDLSLGHSIWRIAGADGLVAQVTFLPPVAAAGRHRRELAAQVEAAIRERLDGAAPSTAPETARRHPA